MTLLAATVPDDTYDYIVVGSGPGGIVTADKLSASGKSVLLIERGPPSSFRWGGRQRGAWLENSNLTRFDVPGLYGHIWQDSAGIKCPDVVPMAGCVLGGGSAINAGLWFKPQSLDWDTQFPDGWKAKDLSAATDRAFRRVPWTDVPSKDGVLYNRQTNDLITKGLVENGWTSVKANNEPDVKRRTVSQSEYFYQHGERGGLLETYLVSATARGNFKLWTNSLVTRVERMGDSVTGVQVESRGYNGTVKLAAGGRVILSAGVFGSAKILFRSGIGPKDQLETVQKAEGDILIDSAQWIDLPVGYNLDDHVNTNILLEHPDIVNYDFNGAYNNPVSDDASAYLCEMADLPLRDGSVLLTNSNPAANRSGILTQAAPNINPIFWDAVKGEDGIERWFQWTGYVGGPQTGKTYTALGLGKTSRGRVTINPSLLMDVSVLPYFNDEGNHDFEAVVTTVSGVVKAISSIPGAVMIHPAPGQDVRDYVQKLAVDIGRTANHWVGTTRLGTDSALEGGKSVVDLNAQVYGTKNLHVVDAGILNGIFTANPQAGIVIAAEKVAEDIMRLHG
ncbi:fungal cellulose binding domain-containing protein [Colletotrichum scovillei]|uniref:fungal cellulose binding domain-containing protein n=1 Tax=Colletotrichum scovillei TaxID=1209932 RepID=UPI0015C2FC82|nr:fungal cellulose binding domain-containing protein [Colletotrichum scovillei]KAF4777677.1 fungal cellulose binding domain-containing protein [Colletotrichum scovillei]